MEVEVEREMDVEPADESPEGAAKPRTRATGAPDRFEITPHLAAWAADNGYTAIATPAETQGFLEHHRAKGSTFKNWDAAWRKWMINAAKWAKPNTHDSPQSPRSQTAAFANVGNTLEFDEDL